MRALRPADVLTAAGSAALLIAMFLPWYAPSGRSETVNAWQAFAVTDVLLGIVVLLGLTLAVSQVALRGPALAVGLAVVTASVTLGAVLLVAFRLLDQPGPNELIELRAGAWIGFAATVATAIGAWTALADERPRPSDPAPPTIERRPAPQS